MAQDDPLATYLDDHLAGSETALELLDRLATRYADSERGALFRALHDEIRGEQDALRALLERLGPGPSAAKQAMGWLAEKATRVKLGLTAGRRDPLALFEALEMLALGITGKRSLWRALAEIQPEEPRLAGLDFAKLDRQAADQHERVERERLHAARAALLAAA